MKKSIKLLLIAVCAVGIFGITGCEDHQARYENPPWLGGSRFETLEESGNYTTFLALMEKANYTEPISKQLFTLFVPDDAAFEEYFKSAGINSVNDLTKDEDVPHMLEALDKRGYKEREIELLLGGNFMRLFKSVWD